mmetsp:Transcript_6694/g.13298  ORF Transcript_6694/g.13298 Transcript_6694/m.13298 type:complete len:445 (-) Transcript_6694:87-1421(-)
MDKMRSVDWRGLVRNATNKVKQYAMNLSPLEVQVEEATNMDTWGPHGKTMAEIAEACYDPEGYRQVLGVIARRLQEKEERWRMCYKALLLLEYLIKHGPKKVALDVANSSSVLNSLKHFEYKDANGKDHGVNIRHRATEISELVENPHRLEEERQKAAENKAKYTGVSASQMRAGATGFGSSTRSGGFHSSSLTRPGEGSAPRSQSFRSQSSTNPTSFSLGGQTSEERDVSPPMASKSFSSTRQEEEISPVRATQARIAKMALSSPSTEETSKRTPKKKLSDVKANPKIAASLGLKMPVASAPPATTSRGGTDEKPSSGDNPMDLLGTLDVPAATSDQDSSHAEKAAQQPAWDPFGGNSSVDVPSTSPQPQKTEASAPLPEDIFASLSNPNDVIPQNQNAVFSEPPKEKVEDVFDPFNTGVATQQVQPAPAASEKKDPFADLLS